MSDSVLTAPGISRGLRDVLDHRFLLKLLVRKEVKVRYRGSLLGLMWSYVKPGVQFVVFYLALGIFLGMEQRQENYAIYLFSGIILVNFFTEAVRNSARSITENFALVKKIYIPRELFPLASVWVSAVHFFPQLVILLLACLLGGWSPSLTSLVSALLGFLIVGIFAVGLGLFFGAVNVFFRDAENIVDLIVLVAPWVAPVLYATAQAQAALGGVFVLYMADPLAVGVELFHRAFWSPTISGEAPLAPDLLTIWLWCGLGVAILTALLGQYTFRRLSGRFAQEL